MKKALNICLFISLVFALQSCTKSSDTSSVNNNTTGQGGSMARFTIIDNYLYSVDNRFLRIYSLANAQTPVLKNTVEIGFDIETIYPFKDKLFIGSNSAVFIFSITNPEQPQQLGTAISPSAIRRCDPVVAKDFVAYASLRSTGQCGGLQSILAVYDITDINNPVEKFTYPIQNPYGLGYSGSALYLCTSTNLTIFNISQPYNPVFIKSISGNFYLDVIPYGNELICWVNDGVILYDITDKFNPVFIKKII